MFSIVAQEEKKTCDIKVTERYRYDEKDCKTKDNNQENDVFGIQQE
jgi:hypothetical protein